MPASITVDNYGPEFAGKVLDAWAYEAGVTLKIAQRRRMASERARHLRPFHLSLANPSHVCGARLCLSLLGTIHDCTLNIGLIELALLLLAWRTTLDFGWSARMASERSLSDALLSRCA
ncbi:hypothetical protein [Burkholderia pseudomallei]|uniref:hypothetical protein n=1 Tax=Burkholderia pseudomallei TaxID=28450 RepID=UPI0005370BC9|nr:hypothetical protein [Burkholderia pseudomallei]KGV18002.1 putative integrase core domain protein [Burkholderia pseudomallei MSHR4503]